MKKLVGSTTSPFVRRIRLIEKSKDYEFECITNSFAAESKAVMAQYTPTGRIPILIDGDTVVWDSMLICEYLSDTPFSLELKKNLVLINEMTDASLQLFQLRKFEVDATDSSLFSQNHIKRVFGILDYFEEYDLSGWNVVTQWLYCTLDWYTFRNVHPWQENHPNLVAFYKRTSEREDVKQTDPRI